MRFTPDQVWKDFGNTVNRTYNQLYTEVICKPPHQIELRPARTLRAYKVGRRAVARDHTQLTDFENLVEY